MEIYEYRILISGIVQGIGFRPAVYRLAVEREIDGEISNTSDGVALNIQTTQENCYDFIETIKALILPSMRIDCISVSKQDSFVKKMQGFQIVKTVSKGGMTEIPIDSAMCPECKKELHDVQGKRYLYPLTACTNCGPRITIIYKLPYDRKDTSMSYFQRCGKCEENYYSPQSSRRFNFETDSCWDCSPWIGFIAVKDKRYYKMKTNNVSVIERQLINAGFICEGSYENSGNEMEKLLKTVRLILDDNGILALKGVGGYQLVADATSVNAVQKIRENKNRKKKPLAVMFSDVDMIKKYCICSEEEALLLDSRSAPIVLLKKKNYDTFAYNLTFEIDHIGAMLPNSPMHHIFVDRPLVMTSANISGEPLIYDDDLIKLSSLADGIFLHDRPINMGIDDALLKKSLFGDIVLRYARGYVPGSFPQSGGAMEGIACGADLKSAFTVISNKRMILSQYIGDLYYDKVQMRYLEILEKYRILFKPRIQVVLVDKHPEYYSVKIGEDLAQRYGCRIIALQHHYAHALSVMAEHSLNGTYACVIMDGTGYGDDNKIWGGEILLVSRKGYTRKNHLEYINLIGGEKAIKEPYRQIVSILDRLDTLCKEKCGTSFSKSSMGKLVFKRENIAKYYSVLKDMLQKGINCIETSSAGRLFDIVAALILGIETYEYEGQAATLVEQYAEQYIFIHKYQAQADIANFHLMLNKEVNSDDSDIVKWIRFGINAVRQEEIMSVDILGSVMNMYEQTNDKAYALYGFHVMLASAVAKASYDIYKNDVADGCILSGGVFQNAILRDLVISLLSAYGVMNIYTNTKTSSNDGSISLGQAYYDISNVIET